MASPLKIFLMLHGKQKDSQKSQKQLKKNLLKISNKH